MLQVRLLLALLSAVLAGPALAQTDAAPGATDSPPLAPLPAPAIDENAPPLAYIDDALHAIAAHRDGEAMEAIERAESRLLTRSVKPSQARTADQKPLIQQLGEARRALGAGDRLQAVQLLQAASQNPEARSKGQ